MIKTIKTLLIITTLTTALFISFSGTANAGFSQKAKSCVDFGEEEVKQRKDLDGDGMIGLKPSSGFVDEKGCTLSDEEYAKVREDREKNIFQRSPVGVAIFVVVVIGGVAGTIILRKKRKANKDL